MLIIQWNPLISNPHITKFRYIEVFSHPLNFVSFFYAFFPSYNKQQFLSKSRISKFCLVVNKRNKSVSSMYNNTRLSNTSNCICLFHLFIYFDLITVSNQNQN